jgi:hypothetical protein
MQSGNIRRSATNRTQPSGGARPATPADASGAAQRPATAAAPHPAAVKDAFVSNAPNPYRTGAGAEGKIRPSGVEDTTAPTSSRQAPDTGLPNLLQFREWSLPKPGCWNLPPRPDAAPGGARPQDSSVEHEPGFDKGQLLSAASLRAADASSVSKPAAKPGASGAQVELKLADLPAAVAGALKDVAKELGLPADKLDTARLQARLDPQTGSVTLSALVDGKQKDVTLTGEQLASALNKGLAKLPGDASKHLELTFQPAGNGEPARIGLKAKELDLEVTKLGLDVSFSVTDAMRFLQALGDAGAKARFDTPQAALESVRQILGAQAELNPRMKADFGHLGTLSLDVRPAGQVPPLAQPDDASLLAMRQTLDKGKLLETAERAAGPMMQLLDGMRPALEAQLKKLDPGFRWPSSGDAKADLKALVGKLPADFKIDVAQRLNDNGSVNGELRIGPIAGKVVTASGDLNTGGMLSLLWSEYAPFLKLSTPPADDPKTKGLDERQTVFVGVEKDGASVTLGYSTKDLFAMMKTAQQMVARGQKPTAEDLLELTGRGIGANVPVYAHGKISHEGVSGEIKAYRDGSFTGEPPAAAVSNGRLMPSAITQKLREMGVSPDVARFDVQAPTFKDGKLDLKADVYVKSPTGEWQKLDVQASLDLGKNAKAAGQLLERLPLEQAKRLLESMDPKLMGQMLLDAPREVFGKTWDALGPAGLARVFTENADRAPELIKAIWKHGTAAQKAAFAAAPGIGMLTLLKHGLKL